MGNLVFGHDEASHYESWFETAEGRRIDNLEKALLGQLLLHFGPPGTLLDIGCGTGHFALWFREQGWLVVGADVSWPMLQQARQGREVASFIAADGTALPFGDASWDVAAMITALEFMPEQGRALQEALRVSRRGVLVGALNKWSLLALQRRIQGWFAPSPYNRARFLSVGDLHQMMREAEPSRPMRFVSATTVWPRWLFVRRSRLGCGGFLGVAAIAGGSTGSSAH